MDQQSLENLKPDIIARVNRYRADVEQGRRSLRLLAKKSGVSLSWLSKLVNGDIPNPTINSLLKVHHALLDAERRVQ